MALKKKQIENIYAKDKAGNKNVSKTKVQIAFEENRNPRTGKINERDCPRELIEQRIETKKRAEEKRLMKKYDLTEKEAKRLRRKNQNEKSTTACGKNAEAIIKNRKRNEAAKKRGPRERLMKKRLEAGEEIQMSETDPTRLRRKDMSVPHRASDQKCVVDEKKVRDKLGWGMTTYEDSYPQIAFDILSSEPFKTKAHLCKAFFCSKPTLINWIRKYPEMKEAVECGLAAGEARFRDKAQLKAWMAQKEVNNGLICMLARNVYGISKESDIEINIGVGKDSPGRTAVEEMQERGIPLPTLDICDMDATISTINETALKGQGNDDNDRTESNAPGQRNEGTPVSFPIPGLDSTNNPGGPLPGNPEGPGIPEQPGKGVLVDGGSLEPGKTPETSESRTSKGLAGEQTQAPLAGMNDLTEPSSPQDVKRALKAKETALIRENMENTKLRAQIRSLKIENANRVKEQSKRIVAGFGNDFSTSDGDTLSPFGVFQDVKDRKME